MAIEEYTPEQKEKLQTLEEFLKELEQEGIETMPIDGIKKGLNEGITTILTRDFCCGIRIARSGSKRRGYTYITCTTNELEDPEHPIAKKFRHRKISID